MKYEYEWLPTSRAALALGRSADTLKRKRESTIDWKIIYSEVEVDIESSN